MVVEDEEEVEMERAEEELMRRSRYLSSLIQQQRIRSGVANKRVAGEEKESEAPAEELVVVPVKEKREGKAAEEQPERKMKDGHGDVDQQGAWSHVRVRAADMPLELQKRAFRCAREVLARMPRLDSKHLALTLKKETQKLPLFSSRLEEKEEVDLQSLIFKASTLKSEQRGATLTVPGDHGSRF